MWSEALNEDFKPYHLAPLFSVVIVILGYLTRSHSFQNTLFFLNIVGLPFLTGVIYAYSQDKYDQATWISVILGPWPTVVFILIADLVFLSIYILLCSPILFVMASLGAVITQFVRLKTSPEVQNRER
jgi:hypothetical protein